MTDEPPDWKLEAACRGLPTEWFYPDLPTDQWEDGEVDDGTVGQTEHLYTLARSICNSCPVQAECLAYSLENKERFGMWGSTAPIGRLRVERKHRRQRMIDRRANENA